MRQLFIVLCILDFVDIILIDVWCMYLDIVYDAVVVLQKAALGEPPAKVAGAVD